MGQYSRVLDRFEYHVEDLDCCYCLHYKKVSERIIKTTGCGELKCRYDDILQDAIKNGRIKRRKGYFRVWDESPGSR